MIFQRITVNPEACGGKPVIRDLRFPVSRLLGLLASGETKESILAAYPYLEPGDIQEALSLAEGPGIILFRGGDYSDKEMCGLLEEVLARVAGEIVEHSICVVDKRRIRITGLPLTPHR